MRPARRAMVQATLATTKMNLATQKLSQNSSATRIKSTTYLWPYTCHPKPPSNLFSILVLRPSERAPSKSSCGKRRRCARNHLVTSHVTVMHIPASGALAESHAGHIPSRGHQIKQSMPPLIKEDILQQCPDCTK